MTKKGDGNLLLELTLSQPMVIKFLNAKERRSESTRKIYTFALAQFQTFLYTNFPEQKYTLETILKPLAKRKINVYTLLDEFVGYLDKLNGDRKLSPRSIKGYLNGVRSYIINQNEYDIEITPSKIRSKITMPATLKRKEQPIDANNIRTILKACDNRRLKSLLLMLASGGFRIMEALKLQWSDVNFEITPTQVRIRAENSKTDTERLVYISNEATRVLKQWQEFKYRERVRYVDGVKADHTLIQADHDIIFSTRENVPSFEGIYIKVKEELNKVLETINMNQRKTGMLRRMVTFHSFRRFTYTTICNQTADQAYADYFLGHSGSSYWTNNEEVAREFYKTKCMPVLTFFDWEQQEKTGKNTEAQIAQLIEKQNKMLEVIAELRKNQDEDLKRRIADGDLVEKLPEGVKKVIYEARRKARPAPWNVEE